MKNSLYLLLILFLAISSCQKQDPEPVNTCRLDAIDRGSGYLHNYTYNQSGKIATMTRVYADEGTYVYTFGYDNTGLLIKSDMTLDGVKHGAETYTYLNGKISKVNYSYENGDIGTNNIKYDTNGNITEFSYEAADNSYKAVQFFEYDNQGLFSKRGYKDVLNGDFVYFEAKYVGKNPTKSTESLLADHGLPFDVLTGFPWQKMIAGEGSAVESFSLDDEYNLVSNGISTTKSTKVNAKGYVVEIEFEDSDKSNSKSTFTLSNCN